MDIMEKSVHLSNGMTILSPGQEEKKMQFITKIN